MTTELALEILVAQLSKLAMSKAEAFAVNEALKFLQEKPKAND